MEKAKRFLAIALVAVTFASMLVACGSKDNEKAEKEREEISEDVVTEEETKEEAPTTTTKPQVTTTKPPVTTTKAEPQYGVKYLNKEKVKAVQDKDSFPLKITNKEVIAEAFGGLITLDGNDALKITVKNESGKEIIDYTVELMGYDKNGKKVPIDGSLVTSVTGGDRLLLFSPKEGEKIANGTEHELFIRCRKDNFEGVVMIVSDYTTSDGTKYENPLLEEWEGAVAEGTSKPLN